MTLMHLHAATYAVKCHNVQTLRVKTITALHGNGQQFPTKRGTGKL